MCNTLTGRTRPTDSGAKGVTSKSHLYAPVAYEGYQVILVDTVGLHEGTHGTVPADKAVLQLVELLSNAREGFNLLVHVSRATRITQEHQEDYDFFVNKMTQRHIPVVLVLTGCENELPMSAWADRNNDHFKQFLYKKIIPTCFAEGGPLEPHFAPLRAESREAVLSTIVASALPESHRLYGPNTGKTFNSVLASLWNDFVDLAGLPAEYRAKLNESGFDLLKRIGVPKNLAEMAIQHIPDLVGDLASKAPLPGSGPIARMGARKLLERLLRRSGK